MELYIVSVTGDSLFGTYTGSLISRKQLHALSFSYLNKVSPRYRGNFVAGLGTPNATYPFNMSNPISPDIDTFIFPVEVRQQYSMFTLSAQGVYTEHKIIDVSPSVIWGRNFEFSRTLLADA